MPREKLKVARRLAEEHFRVEPNLEKVFLLEPLGEDNDEEPLKLLEVVKGSLAQGIYPIRLRANPGAGIPYQSLVVEVAPDEWEAIRDKGSIPFRGARWKVGIEFLPAAASV